MADVTVQAERPDSANRCPVCDELVALDDRGGLRWHQHADTPPNSYHLIGCAGSDRATESGILLADTDSATPRYTWIVRDGDDGPWILLGYRWTSRKDALQNTGHWLHHHEQVKTVEVVGRDWAVI